MQNLQNFIPEKDSLQIPISEQKNILRKKLLTLRESTHKYADPNNWGPKQFYRTLELLKIKQVEDLEGKYLIACFFPIRHELEISSLATEKWLFPKMGENKKLLWFEYGDGKTGYTKNKHGIKEKKDEFCFEYKEKDLPMLCFVPGIAAAQDGARLGYGGGYYDNFLRKFKEKVTSVLCLPSKEFLFNVLPTEEHDEKVDLIVF